MTNPVAMVVFTVFLFCSVFVEVAKAYEMMRASSNEDLTERLERIKRGGKERMKLLEAARQTLFEALKDICCRKLDWTLDPAELKDYGSFGNGLVVNGSDVDCALMIGDVDPSYANNTLYHIGSLLWQCYRLRGVVVVNGADEDRDVSNALMDDILEKGIPVKLQVAVNLGPGQAGGPQKVDIDLGVNKHAEIENTELLAAYCENERVRDVALLAKTWAKDNKLIDAKNGLLSSFDIVLFVIAWALTAKIVPNLQCRTPRLSDGRRFVRLKEGEKTVGQDVSIVVSWRGFLDFFREHLHQPLGVCIQRISGSASISDLMDPRLSRSQNRLRDVEHREQKLVIMDPFRGERLRTVHNEEAVRKIAAALEAERIEKALDEESRFSTGHEADVDRLKAEAVRAAEVGIRGEVLAEALRAAEVRIRGEVLAEYEAVLASKQDQVASLENTNRILARKNEDLNKVLQDMRKAKEVLKETEKPRRGAVAGEGQNGPTSRASDWLEGASASQMQDTIQKGEPDASASQMQNLQRENENLRRKVNQGLQDEKRRIAADLAERVLMELFFWATQRCQVYSCAVM